VRSAKAVHPAAVPGFADVATVMAEQETPMPPEARVETVWAARDDTRRSSISNRRFIISCLQR
jgi:hypothetical protein